MRLIPSPSSIDPVLAAAVARYCAAGVSSNTVRAYDSAWRSFETWCTERGLTSLPAMSLTAAAYLADRASTLRPSSLGVHVAAIRQGHQSRGHDSPTSSSEVLGVLKGVRREHGVAPRKKAPITPGELRIVVNRLGARPRDHRDRALLLLGFCAGFRRSELVGLDVSDVIFRAEGLLVQLRRSKTDQDQRGRTVAVEYGTRPESCPGTALEDWLAAAGIKSGPVFRAVDRHGNVRPQRLNGRAVARVLQYRAAEAGLSTLNLAGHSLRSGLATAAARAKVDERDIAERTGHRNLSVLRGYIHSVDPFEAALTQRLGF
jgi:site-specific recombinase XerD